MNLRRRPAESLRPTHGRRGRRPARAASVSAEDGGGSQPPAQRISAEEFVGRVADDLGIPPEEARDRIRAVFGTLREAVTHGEFDDVLAELDPEYAELA